MATSFSIYPERQTKPRAPRFAISVPVQYRVVTGGAWQTGKTENISHSGLLFRSSHGLLPRTSVEVTFTLPVIAGAAAPAQVVCRGRVVRAAPREPGSGLNRLAIVFEDYRLEPQTPTSPSQPGA
jgi:hypothetical protein